MTIVVLYTCISALPMEQRTFCELVYTEYTEARSVWTNECIDNDEEIKDVEDYVHIGR